MDKKFLNKVLDQIVRETEIDYENEKIFVPFLSLPFIFIYSLFSFPLLLIFPRSQNIV
jgi:hypothetical protein